MPDTTGNLTEKDRKKALDWLEAKVNGACEACGHRDWLLSNYTVAPLNISNNGTLIGGDVTPSFCVICKHCGNTKFFNAVIAKIIPPAEEEKNAKK